MKWIKLNLLNLKVLVHALKSIYHVKHDIGLFTSNALVQEMHLPSSVSSCELTRSPKQDSI